MPDPRTDLDLIDAANNGDTDAFDALYLRYRDWVVNLAVRFTGDRDIALDVLQDTFIYVLGKFPGFELTARMTTFLYPVVRNTAIRHQRKRRRFIGPGDEFLDMAPHPRRDGTDPIERDESLGRLARALETLTPAHREVVLMRFVDHMTVREIAIALDIPEGTVKSRVHHAVDRLRADPETATYFHPDP